MREPRRIAWRDIAESQHGVISRSQDDAGVGPNAVTRMAARGELRHTASGIYLVGGVPWTSGARLWCAVLATDGVLAFATAAYLWGLVSDLSPAVHVAIDHERRARCPSWIRLHRVPVAPSAVTTRACLPVTSRPWTVLDYLGTLDQSAAVTLADRAVQRGRIRAEDVSFRLARYPGRRGNAVLRRLAEVLSDGAAAESERMLHRLPRSAGLTGWRPNFDVWLDGELIAVIDVAFPHLQIGIEVDGHPRYSDRGDAIARLVTIYVPDPSGAFHANGSMSRSTRRRRLRGR